MEAVQARDYQVVQAVVLFMASIFIASNLIVDILYAYLDPPHPIQLEAPENRRNGNFNYRRQNLGTLPPGWPKPCRTPEGSPLVPIFIIIFVLVLPAVFANVWSNAFNFDPEVGTLQDRLVPPAWIKAKVQSLQGGVNFDNVEVYKNGELVQGAVLSQQGMPFDANNEPIVGIIEYRSAGETIKIGRALVYPGGVETAGPEGHVQNWPAGWWW